MLILGVIAGSAWVRAQDPVWEASTSVLVHPMARESNVVGGRTQGQVNLDTEAQLVRSTTVAGQAAELLPGTDPEDLIRRVSVRVPPNTSVLVISFAAATPAQAQAGARAFAQAYLADREAGAAAEQAARTTAIEATIEELEDSLTKINEQLAGVLPQSAAAATLEGRRDTAINQLQTLTTRRDELTTAVATPSLVISDARLPHTPSRPRPAIALASGAALGLVFGFAAAGLAERLTRRVHRPADLARRVGLPVLAALTPATAPRRAGLREPDGPTARAFDRLRNEVTARSRAGRAEAAGRPGAQRGRVIVVASASATAGPATGLTAAALAGSLARTGHPVILVTGGAGPGDEGGDLPELLGAAATPGLADILAGHLPVTAALQPCPWQPRLQVLPLGAAGGSGLLQSPALRPVLTALAQRAGYVVVTAPPTASSADAQSVAGHADAAILVVQRRRSRLREVVDAADQLRRVGAPLLGAVMLPSLRRERGPARPASSGSEHPGAGEPVRPRTTTGRTSPPRPYRLPDASPAGASGAGRRRDGQAPEGPPPDGRALDGQTVVLPRTDAGGAPPDRRAGGRS